jgi:imidazole glycerol-phosphate synthase subunit HisH
MAPRRLWGREMRPEITILDYGAGNLRSVVRAFEHGGASVDVTSDPSRAARASRLVLPGQGHFGQCMGRLEESGLADAVREHVDAGRPFLGICVGMQLLYQGSEEAPGAAGFRLLQGHCQRIPTDKPLPHVGWNAVEFTSRGLIDPLLHGVAAPEPRFLYHVHTYATMDAAAEELLATCEYDARFAAIVRRDNVWGIQGHPEKSQDAGLAILANFASIEG